MTNAAFERLVDHVRTDTKGGLDFVFKQTQQYCVRTLIKKTGCDREDAKDVYMDALIIFREKILSGKLLHLSNVKTYMFGICYNVWRDLNRAHNKWSGLQTEVERQYYLLNTSLEEDEEDIIKTRLKEVTIALNSLGEKCRRLLQLVYLDQRPQQEIAQLMNFANANVVKVTRFRCYEKWMKALAKENA